MLRFSRLNAPRSARSLRTRPTRTGIALVAFVALAGCGKKSTGPAGNPVATVTVSPTTASLQVGGTQSFTATVRNAAGATLTGLQVAWSSSNNTVVSISNTGVATALAIGSATVTATSEGRTGSAEVTVTPPTVATVAITPSTASIEAGATQALTVTLRDAAGTVLTGRSVTWTSTADAIATVAQTGLVTGVSVGSATITATSEGRSNTATITVVPAAAATVTITPDRPTIDVGATQAMVATLRDARGAVLTGRTVTWSSGTTTVATVSGTGVVTGVAVGTSTVTALSEGKTGSTLVTVAGGVPDIPPSKLAAGDGHACVIELSGPTACWGGNGFHQLADASAWPSQFSIHRTPIVVQGGTTFASIAAGLEHTCGLTSSGAAFCWGRNQYGQVGTGSTSAFVHQATAVAGGLTFKRIALGLYHTCGITTTGQARCWGGNFDGQLGTGNTTNSSTPAAIAGSRLYSDISAGDERTCAVDDGGAALCWGTSTTGPASTSPVVVSTNAKFVRIAASAVHTCALDRNGQAFCWGVNSNGQLGNGGTATSVAPVAVAGGLTLVAIDVSGANSCGLDNNGQAHCWGANHSGQLGSVGGTFSSSPRAVSGGHVFTEIAVGGGGTDEPFACGLLASRAVWCWGGNSSAQLGHGLATGSTSPVRVAGGRKFTRISVGTFSACALMADGSAFCFGANAQGTLGNGTTDHAYIPTSVSGNHRFSTIAVGGAHACAINMTQDAWCWGSNNRGQLGTGNLTESNVPVAVTGGLKFAQISPSRSNDSHTCALTTAGKAYCWGGNSFGQLGDGSAVQRTAPVPVASTETFVQIVAGNIHTCALSNTGEAWCWGINGVGQVGDGTFVTRTSPVRVTGGKLFTRITSVDRFVCGLEQSGAASCWGENSFGMLGNGTTNHSPAPVSVTGGHVFTSIAAGGGEITANSRGFTCATKTDGTLWCWGRNNVGELLDGTTANKSSPTQVRGSVRFVSVSGGGFNACGFGDDGEVYCWGNGDGRFGDGNQLLGLLTLPKRIFY